MRFFPLASLLLLLAITTTGCGTSRKAQLATRQHQIDSLTVQLDTLRQRLVRLEAEQALMTLARDRALAQRDSARARVVVRGDARVDSLREAYVLQFIRGQELTGRLQGRTLCLLHFESGSTTLTAAGRARLDALAARIRRLPATARLRVEGHTDAVPLTGEGGQNNRLLSAERAAAAARYLAQATGFDAARIESAGFGADHPLVPNDTAEGRRINRRVRVAVIE